MIKTYNNNFKGRKIFESSEKRNYKVIALNDLECWQGVLYKKSDKFDIYGIEESGYLIKTGGHGDPIDAFKIGVDVEILNE